MLQLEKKVNCAETIHVKNSACLSSLKSPVLKVRNVKRKSSVIEMIVSDTEKAECFPKPEITTIHDLKMSTSDHQKIEHLFKYLKNLNSVIELLQNPKLI